MLDSVTWVKQRFAGAHVFLSLVCGHLYICDTFWKLAVGAKGNYLSGKLQSRAGPGRFRGVEDGGEGTVYLSNSLITSVGPPPPPALLKSPAFESVSAM